MDVNTEVTIIEEDSGRTVVSDIIVGTLMMILSLACGLAYSFILKIMWKDKDMMKLPSYQIMFMLGVFDVIQCIPHFVTGIFTISQTVFHYYLAKLMGVLATPCYVGYAVLTVVLGFNRFIQLFSRRLDDYLFSNFAVKIWIGIGLLAWFGYVCALASPFAAIIYNPQLYSWAYDESPYSRHVARAEMYIEVVGIAVSGVFYILVVILLAHKRKKFLVSSQSKMELKILIQASAITLYCTVLNFFWHNENLLPANIWTYTALNFMWIGNSGVYPLIYVIVNRAIRERIRNKPSTLTIVSQTPKSFFHKPNIDRDSRK